MNLATKMYRGSLLDYQSVYDFGKSMDVLTIEIENVNVEALEVLEKRRCKSFSATEDFENDQGQGITKAVLCRQRYTHF